MNNCCISFAGDEYDHHISRIIGHHPNCPTQNLKFVSYKQKVRFATALDEADGEPRSEDIIRILVSCFRKVENIPITPKEKFIQTVKVANINKDGWEWDVIESIANSYAKGYIQCKVETLNVAWDSVTPKEKQEDLLEFADWDIWK